MPNPRTKEFGLKHRFAYDFMLRQEQASPVDFATVISLFFADHAKTESIAQDLQVNRANDSYEGVVNTPACFMNSRVNKIKITEYIRVAQALDVPDALLWKSMFSFNFSDVDILDPAGVSILTALGFQKNADTLSANYSGTDMKDGSFCHADQDGLTSNAHLETVVTRPSFLRDAREGSLGPAVRKVMIGPMMTRCHKDFPIFSERWYNVPGMVKRMNAFAGCFMHYGLNAVKTAVATAAEPFFSNVFDSELTGDEDSLAVHIAIEFNEFNDSFDQVA